jgi:PIN domain nuclease of toxin-antitoxin system
MLLDTHVAVWAVTGFRLSSDVLDLIADPANDVAVSLASLWEIAIKNALDRPVRDPIGLTVTEAADQFKAASFRLLSMDLPCLALIEELPLLHRDPFDRVMIAQAQCEQMSFLTHDKTLAAYGDLVIVV